MIVKIPVNELNNFFNLNPPKNLILFHSVWFFFFAISDKIKQNGKTLVQYHQKYF